MISRQPIASPDIVVPVSFLTLRCGKCGNTDFKVKILPQNNQPTVQAISCSKCRNTWRVDNRRFLEDGGQIDFNNLFDPKKGVTPNA